MKVGDHIILNRDINIGGYIINSGVSGIIIEDDYRMPTNFKINLIDPRYIDIVLWVSYTEIDIDKQYYRENNLIKLGI